MTTKINFIAAHSATIIMSMNITQTISSPLPPVQKSPEILINPASEKERECWSICRDRFKYVILLSVAVQFLLFIIYSILLVNFSFLNPKTWIRESLAILFSPLMLFSVIHGYFKLKPFMQEQVYSPSRFIAIVKSFSHETLMLTLNLVIGFCTSQLFLRLLEADFRGFVVKSNDKKFLNEKFAFLLLNGAFIRCYFYFKRRDIDQSIIAPVVHQSNFLQLRRQFIFVLKTSLIKSFMSTFYFIGFYIVFGAGFCHVLVNAFGLNIEDSSLLDSIFALFNPRLLIYSWMLSSLIWCNMELIKNITDTFVTQPMQFPIEGALLTLSDAMSLSKFRITQQLAAQDFFLLADNPNNLRRKQFYALSNPGGHPHNWKTLVQKSLEMINKLSNDLQVAIDASSKNNNSIQSNLNQPLHQFYESKRFTREFNDFNGMRSLATSPMKYEPALIEKKTDYVNLVKKKLMSNRVVFYFFGETSGAKICFLLNQNYQNIEWIVQGISAIVTRSIKEDSYGVVQQDIKQIIKSFIKLKSILDKVGSFNVIAKDRTLLSLKAAIRRSLYRVTSEFSRYFDDLLLDPEDVQALRSLVMFKEL